LCIFSDVQAGFIRLATPEKLQRHFGSFNIYGVVHIEPPLFFEKQQAFTVLVRKTFRLAKKHHTVK
jgi:hypothetical protein